MVQFVNENTAVAEVLDISEIVIPDEGMFTVTVWYRLTEQELVEQKDLRPEELSAELLDRAMRASQPKNAFDMLADKDMVNTSVQDKRVAVSEFGV